MRKDSGGQHKQRGEIEPSAGHVSEEKTVQQYLSVPLPLIIWKTSIRDFTDEDIKNMATSLRVHGQIQAIVCKPPENGVYEGICGRLRYEGAKYACLQDILVRVHEFESGSEIKAWQLAENLHRKELTALQRAEAYKKLYKSLREETGGVKDKSIVSTIAETQERLTGEKPAESTIYDYMRVAELPEEVKKKITVDRSFGLEHAKQLLRLKDKPEKQLKLADEFLESVYNEKPLSVKKLKKKVDGILKRPTDRPTLVKRKFDVWNIAKVDLEKPFGDPDYPGAIPGDIVANVLMWFLPDGGKVVDPMAGGGVTEDVCRALGPKYRVLLYDSKPLNYQYRESVHFNDIKTGKLPKEAHGADLIFADPPYGPLKQYGAEVGGMKSILTGLANASYEALKEDGLVAILMQNYYADGECLGEFIPLVRWTAEIFEGSGFHQIFEATVPLYGKVARSEDHMTHIDRALMVFVRS